MPELFYGIRHFCACSVLQVISHHKPYYPNEQCISYVLKDSNRPFVTRPDEIIYLRVAVVVALI